MRKFKAIGVMKMFIIWMIVAIGFILFGLTNEKNGGVVSSYLGVGMIPIFVYCFFVLYNNHWIIISNNKISICRYTKKIYKSTRIGKWEKRIDDFRLEDIVQYGVSKKQYGRNVEGQWGAGGPVTICVEYSFTLKNGKIIGFEGTYFTKKQRKEIFEIVLNETGIKGIG